jgi:hypothetical protein
MLIIQATGVYGMNFLFVNDARSEEVRMFVPVRISVKKNEAYPR